MTSITEFQGPNRWLSNFWPAQVVFAGISYPTVEHAYQAAKSDVQSEREAICLAKTPGDAKRLGKRVTMRKDWNAVKLDVMLDLLRQKFAIPTLRAKLLATGDLMLVEGNPWGDYFWGVCRGKGENHLGRLLMGVRSEIKP